MLLLAAGAGCCAELLLAAGCVPASELDEAAAASLVCTGGGAVAPGGGVDTAGCKSFFISEAAPCDVAPAVGSVSAAPVAVWPELEQYQHRWSRQRSIHQKLQAQRQTAELEH